MIARTRIGVVLGVWGLFYCLYRTYYAPGGTVGMFGTPVSHQQWLMVNVIGTFIVG